MTLPLSGVRIVSVGQNGAGRCRSLRHPASCRSWYIPRSSRSRIFKRSAPAGAGPQFFGPGDSHFYEAFNRNRRSIGLDPNHPKGQEIFRKLVQRCMRCSTLSELTRRPSPGSRMRN